MNRPRVLIFATAYYPLVGGVEVALKEITDRLPEFDFQLVCARLRPGLASLERIGNVSVRRVGFGCSIDKWLLPVLGPLAAHQLVPALRGEGGSAVVWSLMASYGGFAALAYAWLHPPVKLLLTLQEGDPLEHYAKRAGCLACLHRKIFQRADAVQAISHFLAGWAVRMGFKGEPQVIPNGADLKLFSPSPLFDRGAVRKSLGYADTDVVIITTSRLVLKNGVNDLIRALSFLPPNVKALIVGEGADRERLVALTMREELQDRVTFLGKKEHVELPALLFASDMFVRASLSEGLGVSFLEAMAAGLPVIATPVGGIPDFLTEAETGLFCQPRDPASIAAAVNKYLADPALQAHCVHRARALVEARYEWGAIARRIGDMLQTLTT